jgi:hypothetical protein
MRETTRDSIHRKNSPFYGPEQFTYQPEKQQLSLWLRTMFELAYTFGWRKGERGPGGTHGGTQPRRDQE